MLSVSWLFRNNQASDRRWPS